MTNESAQESVKKTSPLVVVLFWLYVTIPLAWGVYDTILKAAKLFD